MKTGFRVLIYFLFVIFFSGCDLDSSTKYPFVVPPEPDISSGARLNIVMLYVAHGNSTLMVMPSGKIVLIDSGLEWAARKYVLPFLDRHGINKIDYYIITHYHSDHVGAKDEIIRKYQVETIWDNKSFYTGQMFNFEGTWMTIFNAPKTGVRTTKDPNRTSLSFSMSYNGFVYSHGGDIYDVEQDEIMEQFDVRAHIYNTNHHMKGPVSKSYLIATDPYLFYTSADTGIYGSSAYNKEFQYVLDYLYDNGARLIESLVSVEIGHLVLNISDSENWHYYTIPDAEFGMATDLLDGLTEAKW